MGTELQGDGETILVRVEVPEHFRDLLADTPTVFSRASFPDGTEAGVRLHMLRPVEGEERHGIIEVRIGEVPKAEMGDVIELVAGGVMRLRCVVAEP
jgi:hypothetical protein